MNTNQSTAYAGRSYFSFIWKERENRIRLLFAIAICIIQFSLFKVFYPYPDFFNDSKWYILAASKHWDINIWPIGYSKFLAVFHGITRSHTLLVIFQYFFMQLALTHFYFTASYFFKPSRLMRNVLFCFFMSIR